MKTLPLLLIVGLSACSTITEGRTQRIFVDTRPQEANCYLEREGEILSTVKTPAYALVEKTKYDINIFCNKPGYKQGHYLNKSGIEGATFGNIVMGGGIGWAIDSATGSDNKYDDSVVMNLEKK